MIDTAKTGRLISVCRKDAGLTQEELAAKLGVTPQAVSRWERGSSVPDIDMLLPLAKMFSINVESLLTGEITPYGAAAANSGEFAPKRDIMAAAGYLHNELGIKIATGICKMEDEDFKNLVQNLIDGVGDKRCELARQLGILMPTVHIRDEIQLKENEYAIQLKNKTVCTGEFYMGMSFALSDGESFPEAMDGIETQDYSGRKVRWVRNDKIPEAYKPRFQPAQNMILGHFHDMVVKNLRQLVNRDMVKQMADAAALAFPVTVADVVPRKISYAQLAKLLMGILDKGKPVNDLRAILEAADEAEDLNDIPALAQKIAREI